MISNTDHSCSWLSNWPSIFLGSCFPIGLVRVTRNIPGFELPGINFRISLDYGFSYNSSEAQFRFPIALQILFAILTLIGIVFLPESPRWVRLK